MQGPREGSTGEEKEGISQDLEGRRTLWLEGQRESPWSNPFREMKLFPFVEMGKM